MNKIWITFYNTYTLLCYSLSQYVEEKYFHNVGQICTTVLSSHECLTFSPSLYTSEQMKKKKKQTLQDKCRENNALVINYWMLAILLVSINSNIFSS